VGMSAGKVVYDGPATGLTDDVLKNVYGGASWLA
jgi:phosphonate transport system ATP-binding protein